MLPLSNHVACRVTSVDSVYEAIHSLLGTKLVGLPSAGTPCETQVNRCALPSSHVMVASFSGGSIVAKASDADHVRLQLRHAGAGQTTMCHRQVPLTATIACIASEEMATDFGDGFAPIVWRVPIAYLTRKLAALTGRPITKPLQFDAAIDLATPEGANLRHVLTCILNIADTVDGTAARMVLAELEQALAVALFGASEHNHRRLLDRDSPGAAPWQVHRVESYIEANWSKPLGMEDIVAASGASARSIFRTFTRHRGYSPMEFLKRVRLQQARRMLDDTHLTTTVTDVALSCGFGDLSRFSKDFLTAFGEAPSAVLRRQRIGRQGIAHPPMQLALH